MPHHRPRRPLESQRTPSASGERLVCRRENKNISAKTALVDACISLTFFILSWIPLDVRLGSSVFACYIHLGFSAPFGGKHHIKSAVVCNGLRCGILFGPCIVPFRGLYYTIPRHRVCRTYAILTSSAIHRSLLAACAVAMATAWSQFLLVAEAELEASSGQGPGGFGASDGGAEEQKADVL